MAPQMYRKTALVEALQWTGDNCAEMDAYLNDGEECVPGKHLVIQTLEGDLTAQVGDWVLRGPEGECWPVKGSIFAATYEAVSDDEAAGVSEVERLREERDEARSWARHGYEIGQRSTLWSDYGVAPRWLTEGWPNHFEADAFTKAMCQLDELLANYRAQAVSE